MQTDTAISSYTSQYYVITRHWASDLDFFKIETAFLHRLLDDYLVRSSDQSYIEKLKQADKKLLKLKKDEHQLKMLLTAQLKHLEPIVKDIIPENTMALVDKQVQLEYLMTNLIHEYHEVKKEIFTLAEMAMQ